jgi:hypothetical protein
MGTWEADATISGADSYYGYYWVVPAQVHGNWVIDGIPAGKATIQINQKFQKFDGSVNVGKQKFPITEGLMKGAEMTLRYRDASNTIQTIIGQVSNNQLSGNLDAGNAKITGQRQR